jgi:hypothetical protein
MGFDSVRECELMLRALACPLDAARSRTAILSSASLTLAFMVFAWRPSSTVCRGRFGGVVNAVSVCKAASWSRRAACWDCSARWRELICSSWLVKVCAVEVCAISVCAISVGSGIGRLSAVVVCASAVKAAAPASGRCASICPKSRESSSFLVSCMYLSGAIPSKSPSSPPGDNRAYLVQFP